jgi:hypothetical protein
MTKDSLAISVRVSGKQKAHNDDKLCFTSYCDVYAVLCSVVLPYSLLLYLSCCVMQDIEVVQYCDYVGRPLPIEQAHFGH